MLSVNFRSALLAAMVPLLAAFAPPLHAHKPTIPEAAPRSRAATVPRSAASKARPSRPVARVRSVRRATAPGPSAGRAARPIRGGEVPPPAAVPAVGGVVPRADTAPSRSRPKSVQERKAEVLEDARQGRLFPAGEGPPRDEAALDGARGAAQR